MIFYPRDIGLWYRVFDFSKKERPSKAFKDVDELRSWCKEQGVDVDDPTYPFKITEDGYVMQWTVIGYWKASS